MERKETLASRLWRLTHKKELPPPYWAYNQWFTLAKKPIRKWFSAVLIPTIPFTSWRIWGYRMCGYKIGKNVFIGMRCYLDDLCYDKIEIGNNVTISYGVYFACHGRKQGHNKLVIKDGAYIGMRASVIARSDIEIGVNAIVGAMTLVNKSIPDGSTAVGIPCRVIEKKK